MYYGVSPASSSFLSHLPQDGIKVIIITGIQYSWLCKKILYTCIFRVYQTKDETNKIKEQEQEGRRLIKLEQSSKTTAQLYQFYCVYYQVLNVQNNWQIVNTNLSRYRSQSLQVLLDNAQDDSSQDSRTYKLQEEDFIFCLVRSIEEQA